MLQISKLREMASPSIRLRFSLQSINREDKLFLSVQRIMMFSLSTCRDRVSKDNNYASTWNGCCCDSSLSAW